MCRFSAEPDDRPPRGRGRGDRGLNRRWGSERNTHNAGLFSNSVISLLIDDLHLPGLLLSFFFLLFSILLLVTPFLS